MKKNPAKFLLAVCAASGCAVTAVAQTTRIEEIVVTAQYREQRLQDVPVAVTAFGAEDIESAGIESTQDFVNLTPNVTLDDSFTLGNSFLQVRGVAQINNADSPMAIVVDGVPQHNQKQFKQELFDIERIEVLKGPQGSLYGRNAIGGAINIVSKAPTNELAGHVGLGAGNGGLVEATGALSGAIVPDSLLYRVSGQYKDFDGVTENSFLGDEVDSSEHRDLRGRLLWNADDDFTLDARVAYSRANGSCCSDTFIVNPAFNPQGSVNANRDEFDLPYENVLGETTDLDTLDASLKFTWTTQLGDFDYILGYSDLLEKYFGDLDFTSGTSTSLSSLLGVGLGQTQELNIDMQSHELRWTSPGDRRLRWITGLYYLDTERNLDTTGYLDIPGTAPVVSPENFVPFLFISEHNDNRAWAAFGQLAYDLTDDLELTVGLRYDSDRREHHGLQPIETNLSETFSDLQPRAVLTKRWTEDVLTYVGYSRGFRSGGFNAPSVGSRQFEEETLDNFEVGYKSTWLDRRLRLNAALFYSLSDQFQYFFVDVAAAAQVIDNIDEVSIIGGELEVQALVSDNWMLFGSFGYTDGEIEESSERPQDEGNHTPKNQLFTLNLGTELSMPVSDAFDGSLRIDYEHRGKRYWHPDNLNPMGGFGLLNGRLAFDGEQLSVVLWGRNLLDELYWEDYNAAAFSGLPFGDIGHLSRGRTYGAEVQYRF
jgi:iron complex outermembrane receptor protein